MLNILHCITIVGGDYIDICWFIYISWCIISINYKAKLWNSRELFLLLFYYFQICSPQQCLYLIKLRRIAMASFAPASDSDYIPTSSKLPLQELIPYCACICFVTSCYTEFPDCIGCAGKRICLCCYSEFLSCKFSKETEEDIWCHINKGHTYCGSVETCCMVSGDNIKYHFSPF